ncbi:flagellar biosynthesis protein FlhF [Ureibacillus thermophilus]|uniref:flagellar biosynthesis protein FlhF n=1 Tax=Ureibacillus thermophilus TaxID=367743 RepID=UPI003622761F
MKMKKYIAPSINEAMKQVRADLGEEAVIISSKVVVKKKFFGLIREKNFEVLAGIDEMEPPTFIIPEQKNFPPIVPAKDEHHNEGNVSELMEEISSLKEILNSLKQESIQSSLPDELKPFVDFLKHQELNNELITDICDELFAHLKTEKEISNQEMVQIAKNVLHKKFFMLPMGGLSYEKKYVCVLGPTGVGKTTTIAKMAARSVLEKKKKIGFITTDTYRIAAIEQLKTYANLLQAPVEVVYNFNDYQVAIEKFAHLDLVFIDTAGRNYKEVKYVNDLKKLISFDDEVESYLVLSLTAKERDNETIIEQFSEFPIEKFIFTKADETNSIGAMYNLMFKYNKGLAYYTTGQEVPEDIEEATLEKILDIFFQGEFK